MERSRVGKETVGSKLAAPGWPLQRSPIWPDVGTTTAADSTDEGRLAVGQSDIIRPAIGIEGDRVGAAVVAVIDQHAAHTGGAHLGKGDLLDGVGHAP